MSSWCHYRVPLIPASPDHVRTMTGSLWTNRPSQAFRSELTLLSVVTSCADVRHPARLRRNLRSFQEFLLRTTACRDVDDVDDHVVVDEPDDVVAIDGRITVRRHEFQSLASTKWMIRCARDHSLFVAEERVRRGAFVADDEGHAGVGRHRFQTGVDRDVALVVRRNHGRDQSETLG